MLFLSIVVTVLISLPLAITLAKSRKENVLLKDELTRETERRRFLQSPTRGIRWIPNTHDPIVTFWDSDMVLPVSFPLSYANNSVDNAEKLLIDNAMAQYSEYCQSTIESLQSEGKL